MSYTRQEVHTLSCKRFITGNKLLYKPSISPLYIRWAYRGIVGDYEGAYRGLIPPIE